MKHLILAVLTITTTVVAADSVVMGRDFAQVTPGLCKVVLFEANSNSRDRMLVPNNGTLFDPNPAASAIERVCIDKTVPACAFGTDNGNGTWIAAYNNTDSGCIDISPPLILDIGFCCVNLDDCALLDSPFLRTRDESSLQSADLATTLSMTSIDSGSRNMTVSNSGTIFSFDSTNSQVSQVCVNDDIVGCLFQAADGSAYTAHTSRANGCVNLDPTKSLDRGFCCKHSHSCGALIEPIDLQEDEHDSNSLQTRGPIVNNTLAILYEGAPNLVGWELVLTNYRGFNVTAAVPWAVGQICLLSPTALCAFVGEDGTDTVVVSNENGSCAIVGPPQVLIDGICCNAWYECDAPTQAKIAIAAGPAHMASILSTIGTDITNATDAY